MYGCNGFEIDQKNGIYWVSILIATSVQTWTLDKDNYFTRPKFQPKLIT